MKFDGPTPFATTCSKRLGLFWKHPAMADKSVIYTDQLAPDFQELGGELLSMAIDEHIHVDKIIVAKPEIWEPENLAFVSEPAQNTHPRLWRELEI